MANSQFPTGPLECFKQSYLDLHGNVAYNDSLRSCEKFCSHGSSLSLDEINEILQEDMLQYETDENSGW